MTRSPWILLALAAAGCPSAPPNGVDGVPLLQIVRDGALGGDDGRDIKRTLPGLVVVPNRDDDDGNGLPDWQDNAGGTVADRDDDFASLIVPGSIWTGVPDTTTFELVLHGEARNLRLWSAGEVVLGDAGADDLTTWTVPRGEQDLELRVEARSMLAQGWVDLERRDDGVVVDDDWTWITAAPLILNHHLQQTEHVWVVDVPASGQTFLQRFYNNEQMIQTFTEVLGDQFTGVSDSTYGGDVWIQDEIQFGWLTAPGLRTDLVIDSIRDRGLDDFPEDEIVGSSSGVAPDVVDETWGEPLQVNSLDSFGDLEVSPPVTVDGVRYPFGRIYFGGDADRHPSRELTDFLASQKVQRPFNPDTAWLCVGHIDEVTSVVPDPSSDIGFKFVLADVPAAYALLDAQDPSTPLPRYARSRNEFGYELPTVGDIVNDAALRMANEEIQQDILDPMREQFKAELNLTDEDILLMPTVFEDVVGCGDAALIPGMVNLIVSNRGEQTDVFLADPFTRDSDDPAVGQDSDPFIAAVRSMMPDTLDLHFVDNWAVYHTQLGEVHCGTNMTRTPAADWWDVAGHLLEGA